MCISIVLPISILGPLNHAAMSHVQGMPEAWAKLLLNSGISAAEKKKNPQGVIKALEFYTANSSGINEGETKFMTAQRYGRWALVTVLFDYLCAHKTIFLPYLVKAVHNNDWQ